MATLVKESPELVKADQKQAAAELVKKDPRKAEAAFREIISKAPAATSDAATREYETALISLGELYRDEKSVVTTIGLHFASCG